MEKQIQILWAGMDGPHQYHWLGCNYASPFWFRGFLLIYRI